MSTITLEIPVAVLLEKICDSDDFDRLMLAICEYDDFENRISEAVKSVVDSEYDMLDSCDVDNQIESALADIEVLESHEVRNMINEELEDNDCGYMTESDVDDKLADLDISDNSDTERRLSELEELKEFIPLFKALKQLMMPQEIKSETTETDPS